MSQARFSHTCGTALLVSTLVILMAFALPTYANARNKVILFGVTHYEHLDANLPNAEDDARLMTKLFIEMGFDVSTMYNTGARLTRRGIRSAIELMLPDIEAGKNSTVILYFAGHGVRVNGKNYLMTADTEPFESLENIEYTGIEVGELIEQFVSAGVTNTVLFLDACRNDPFNAQEWSDGRGLARLDLAYIPEPEVSDEGLQVSAGVAVSYSTQPGEYASDGLPGENSPYALAIEQTFRKYGRDLTVSQLMREVEARVVTATNGSQRPWTQSRILQDVPLSQW